MTAHAYRSLDAAKIAYANAELLRPADHRWPYLLGHIHRREGEPEKARAAFARAHRARSDDVPALVWLAEVEFTAGDLDAAQAHVDSVLDLDPDCLQAYLVDGRIAHAREDYKVAVEKLEHALRLDVRSKTIRYALGLAYRAAGDLERAEAAMSSSTRGQGHRDSPLMRDPVMRRMRSYNIGARTWVRRGNQAARRGQHDNAIGYFAMAIELDPDRKSFRAR